MVYMKTFDKQDIIDRRAKSHQIVDCKRLLVTKVTRGMNGNFTLYTHRRNKVILSL